MDRPIVPHRTLEVPAMPDICLARHSAVIALTALASAAALCLSLTSRATAQSVAPTAPAAAALPASPASAPLVPYFAPDPELLSAFGGKDGLFKLASIFVDKMRADSRIGHHFGKTKIPRFKSQLGDQFCQLLAGPCVYDGDTMKAAHADLNISKADSFRQVELLQASMDELAIPFAVQNKLLARLAPMYRDIISR